MANPVLPQQSQTRPMTGTGLKAALAVAAGKLSAQLIKVFKIGSGTSLPGKVALKVDADLLQKLGRQVRHKSVAITGTNGKSTTSGLLSSFLENGGFKIANNQLGANMFPGITAALLQKSNLNGNLAVDYAVIEVDEASMPAVSKAIKQDLTLVTNLFRDQLDRYGELDTTAKMIRKGIEQSGGMVALNADDPMVTSIGASLPADRVIYYGVEFVNYPAAIDLDFPVGFPHEVTDCPLCQAPLQYSKILYGHLGHYACPACDFKRPVPWVSADQIDVSATQSRITFRVGEQSVSPVTLQLPGLFNAYNFMAAATAGAWLEVPPERMGDSLQSYHSIFGRAEKKQIHGKNIMILLIKNPVGAAEVLKVVTADPKRRLVILINDNYADGRDISWLWDAPFELLAQMPNPITVSGHRAEDMAVRLRYAGIPAEQIKIQPEVMTALYDAVDQTHADETLYVLPTYTALLQISQALKSR